MTAYSPMAMHQDATRANLLPQALPELYQPRPQQPAPYQYTPCHSRLVPPPPSTTAPGMVHMATASQHGLPSQPVSHTLARTVATIEQCIPKPSASATVDTERAAEPDADISAQPAKAKQVNKKRSGKGSFSSHLPNVDEWLENDTTAMLRNISSRYTAEELLAELMDRGFQDTFDMLYLPMDFKSHRNMGYCFVNFVRPEVARRFADAFNGVVLPRYKSKKVLEVTRAFTQGLKANLEAYQKKDSQRVRNPWFRPMIFDVEGSEAESLEIVRQWNMEMSDSLAENGSGAE